MYPNLVKVNADLIEFGYFEVLTLLFWLGHGEKYLIESNSLFLTKGIVVFVEFAAYQVAVPVVIST